MNSRLACCLALIGAALALPQPAAAARRQYFIAAEDVVWDFAPSNKDLIHCHDSKGACPIPDPWTDSHMFSKVRYIEYTDDSFSEKKPQPEWLGVLGPIIRAEVGDSISVKFCNHSTRGSFGMHPHGVRSTKNNEGAHYIGVNSGSALAPGRRSIRASASPTNCRADSDSGPAKGDLSSKVWWYHSHLDEPNEVNLGLLGPIIITRAGSARRDGSPTDVDREFVVAFVSSTSSTARSPGSCTA